MDNCRRAVPVALLAILLAACAAQPVEPYARPTAGHALAPRPDGAFAGIEGSIRSEHGPDVSGFMLLDGNADGLRWRLALVDSARHSIDAQYYLWYGDDAGRILVQHLLEAADRGVRVRLLLDDLNTLLQDAGTVTQRDRVAALLDAHPNIELRLFNPWSKRGIAARVGEALGDLKRVNQRMHDKQLIVDNGAVILGGRNIGDEYLGLNADFNFRDLDVLGVGPVARQASDVFDLYWNSNWSMPAAALKLAITPEEQRAARARLLERLRGATSLANFPVSAASWTPEIAALEGTLRVGSSRVVADVPRDGRIEQVMLGEIQSMISSARSELLIENAYIIPGPAGIDILDDLGRRGVRMKILTNSLASHDVPAVNSHYKKWRRPILATGAELYETRPDAAIQAVVADTPPTRAGFMGLHAKAMVVDRHRVYVGSMNYDPRSAGINTEMGVFVDSPGLAEALAEVLERDMLPANSWQVKLTADGALNWVDDRGEVLTRQPARSWWQRVEDVLFMAFPKELY
jgi:putative cardiolipin synthase